MRRFDPSPAASIINPMIDFPSTSWSPLRTFTFDLNLFVVCTNNAAGRAWSPKRFFTRKLFWVTPPPLWAQKKLLAEKEINDSYAASTHFLMFGVACPHV